MKTKHLKISYINWNDETEYNNKILALISFGCYIVFHNSVECVFKAGIETKYSISAVFNYTGSKVNIQKELNKIATFRY